MGEEERRSSNSDRKRKLIDAMEIEGSEKEVAKDDCLVNREFKDYLARRASHDGQDGVAEKIVSRFNVGKGQSRIGLVSVGTPFWYWAVSPLGDVVWIDVKERQRSRGETGAKGWMKKSLELRQFQTRNRGAKKQRFVKEEVDWNDRAPVDIIFFDKGISPGAEHPVWKHDSVRLVFWVGGRKNSGPPERLIDDWKRGVMKLAHNELGGVTTLESWIHVAERREMRREPSCKTLSFVDCWGDYLEAGLQHTTFRGVVDPTVPGRESSFKEVEDSKKLGGGSILERKMDWRKDVGKEHVLPSVFGVSCYVNRRISAKELAGVLDFPAELHKNGTEAELQRWTREIEVPFKSRVQVVRSLSGWMEDRVEGTKEQSRKRKLEDVAETSVELAEWDTSRMTEEETLFTPLDSEGGGSLNTEERREDRNLKATKSDDAAIPTYLWDDRVCERFGFTSVADRTRAIKALNSIRKGALQYWKRLVASDYWRWWRCQRFDETTDERERTKKSGLAALAHATQASWWDWDHGSSPFSGECRVWNGWCKCAMVWLQCGLEKHPRTEGNNKQTRMRK